MKVKTTKEKFWESLTPSERMLFDWETLKYIGPKDISENELNQNLINEFSNQQRNELYDLSLISAEQYNVAVRNFKKIVIPFLEKANIVGQTLNRITFSSEEVWLFNDEELKIYLDDALITIEQYLTAIKRHKFIDSLFVELCERKNISSVNKKFVLGGKSNYAYIAFNNFIVLSNVFKCSKHHHL